MEEEVVSIGGMSAGGVLVDVSVGVVVEDMAGAGAGAFDGATLFFCNKSLSCASLTQVPPMQSSCTNNFPFSSIPHVPLEEIMDLTFCIVLFPRSRV